MTGPSASRRDSKGEPTMVLQRSCWLAARWPAVRANEADPLRVFRAETSQPGPGPERRLARAPYIAWFDHPVRRRGSMKRRGNGGMRAAERLDLSGPARNHAGLETVRRAAQRSGADSKASNTPSNAA